MEMRRQLLMLLLAAVLGLLCTGSGLAAPGDIIADVDASPSAGGDAIFGVSVGFDGNFLYYTNFDDMVLHRIDVPPPGGPTPATGHTDFPIVGAPNGINTFSYDATRDVFWAVSGSTSRSTSSSESAGSPSGCRCPLPPSEGCSSPSASAAPSRSPAA
jgi:hypothetical protein